VIRDDRPDLEVLFSKIDHRKTYGKVWIAGAGIGDPTWLSCQTAGLLKTADITIYDDLIHPEIIRKIRGDKIYAGKRAEGEHTPQQTINEILYREALKGKTVLRLKGGDPLIFGRGGEEALYLRERMVPVALIPGVTSAQAAASVLELPLTHRNLSRSLAFLSGQYEDPSLFVSNEADTLVYYMGGGRLDVIGEYLNRVRPGIPSVIVSKLGYPDERIYKTDSESMKTLQAGKPALIINGKTTDLMRVRDKVLYTGLDPSRCNLDARIIHYPLIETVSPDSIRLPDENYQGIIFTSKETISFFIRAGLPVKGRIIAIGPSTRRALKEAGIETDHIPEEYSADGIHQLISRLSGMKYLYPCSSLSGNILHHHPDILPLTVYETRYVEQTPLDLSSFRGVFFTSPSTVQGYLRIYGKLPEDKILYVMGKTTGKALIDSKAESRWIIYQGGSHV
jgi:uroporphyrinogen III methyltransferase/synthase